jgi:ComF family protein
MWKTLGKSFLELLAPRVCPGCDLPAEGLDQAPFCGACAPLLEAVPDAFAPPASISALFVYGGPLAEAIRRLKYQGRTEIGPVLGKLLSQAALPYVGRIDLVMPVPLYPSRLRTRGFNQAALLARPVARRLGLPLDVMALERIRDTAEQAGITRAERALNVKGAFAARAPRRHSRVLLIDDVRTTGATLAAASEALLNAGYSSVHVLALAGAIPRQ